MRLLIISHTPHYRSRGEYRGWGATVREIDHLATLFDEVVHVAPLYLDDPPGSAVPYRASNVRLRPVAPSGGEGLRDKLGIVVALPGYVRAIVAEMRRADAAHVRCPAGISLVALTLMAVLRRPKVRWAKYAGNWQPRGDEPWSYAFQRWWLRRRLHRGIVTVNGTWPGEPEHVIPFTNPCLTEEELEEGRKAAAGKSLRSPVVLLFVGRVEEAKGARRFIEIAERLAARGVGIEAHLVGDGPERERFEKAAPKWIFWHGWLPRSHLGALYSKGHFILHPSISEGWPKALSEAMAYGAVPIAGAVSSIPQLLSEIGAGTSVEPRDIRAFEESVLAFVGDPGRWQEARDAAVVASTRFTYRSYLEAVRGIWRRRWGISLASDSSLPLDSAAQRELRA